MHISNILEQIDDQRFSSLHSHLLCETGWRKIESGLIRIIFITHIEFE